MTSLSPGARLGPYQILGSIGAGGMGEVFRARDTRLDREVALKVLPADVAASPDRLQRFDQEARAAAALSHPNIVVVHDVGVDQGVAFVVSELLEGQTLRQLLAAGAVSARKATEYAIQIANGLAAAHDRGIVHRDLKPENIFITRDGRAKILDFGLAKLVSAPLTGATQATALNTDPGSVLGTAGYMAPEQLRGEEIDQRSDIFSLGAVLYELYSGARAFTGNTAVETMSAILKEEPRELTAAGATVSPAVERVIRRCLEKNPVERFQSARDVTFALDAVSNATSSAHAIPFEGARPPRRSTAIGTLAAVVLGLAMALAGYVAGTRRAAPPVLQPSFKQLTFRSGTVRGARFAPDGQSVVYGAAWEGRPIELYSVRESSPESSAISLPAADLLDVSTTGEMAIALKATSSGPFVAAGTLARASLAGGAARELLEDVVAADWSPDGKQLAVVRRRGNSMQLEYPQGTLVYEAPFWISNPRVSPDGTSIAFITHPRGGDEGSVEILELGSRERRALSADWISIQGLDWTPDGRELWFTATREGGIRAIHAVTPTGVERLVLRSPQRLTLHDISAAGRVLVSGETMRTETIFGSLSAKTERKLSWFDWATNISLSADARLMAFTESGEGAGRTYGVFVRPTDGSPAVRLGDGSAMSISPDGKWVAASFVDDRQDLQILPTGAGETRTLAVAPLERVNAVRWFPDSKRLVVVGRERDRRPRSYEMSLDGGTPKPLTDEGVTGVAVSPDGRSLVVVLADNSRGVFSLVDRTIKTLPHVPTTVSFGGWLADSRAILVREPGMPIRIARVNVDTGVSTPVATIAVGDPAGIVWLGGVTVAPDGDHYTANYFRILGELFLIDGLK